MDNTMDPWDFRHRVENNFAGAVVDHRVELRTPQAWVDVRAANGTVTRVYGDGTAVVMNY